MKNDKKENVSQNDVFDWGCCPKCGSRLSCLAGNMYDWDFLCCTNISCNYEVELDTMTCYEPDGTVTILKKDAEMKAEEFFEIVLQKMKKSNIEDFPEDKTAGIGIVSDAMVKLMKNVSEDDTEYFIENGCELCAATMLFMAKHNKPAIKKWQVKENGEVTNENC